MIVDLRCNHCGNEEERMVKYSELESQTCNVCDSLMERQYTVSDAGAKGLQFKGNGFYQTDFRNK